MNDHDIHNTNDLIERTMKQIAVRATSDDKCDWLRFHRAHGIECELRTKCEMKDGKVVERITRRSFWLGSKLISREQADEIFKRIS